MSLFRFLHETIETPWLRAAAMLGLAEEMGMLRRHPVASDPYLQYFPLRTLFPALLLLALPRCLRARRAFETTGKGRAKWLVWYVAISLGAALAFLWNLDSGFITLAACLATLCFDEIIQRSSMKQALARIAAHCGALGISIAIVIALTSLSLRIADGASPDFKQFGAIQRLFSQSGYFMLPAPLFHASNLYALAALAGLASSIRYLLERRAPPAARALCTLTVLRHLHGAIPPARRPRRERSARHANRSTRAARNLARNSQSRCAPGRARRPPARIHPGDESLFISLDAAVLHWATATPPAAFDSFTELFSTRDIERLLQALCDERCPPIAVGPPFEFIESPALFATLHEHYRQEGAAGRFSLWRRRH